LPAYLFAARMPHFPYHGHYVIHEVDVGHGRRQCEIEHSTHESSCGEPTHRRANRFGLTPSMLEVTFGQFQHVPFVNSQGWLHVNNTAMRWLGVALGALLILSACSEQGEPVSVTTPSESVSSTAPPSSEEPSIPSTEKSSQNDLRTGHLTRTVEAGNVKVAVEYSLRNRVQRWSPGVDQPLTVSMTTVSRSSQKIYLSRVTADLEVSDANGHLDSPDALVDGADISPGFLVTSPSSYTGVLLLPSLPDEATRLTIDFRYELLFLQPRSNPRDFAKQTATDTLVISRQ
jgi:hypothetical protein